MHATACRERVHTYVREQGIGRKGGRKGEREKEDKTKIKAVKAIKSQRYYMHTCSDTRLKISELRASFLPHGEAK